MGRLLFAIISSGGVASGAVAYFLQEYFGVNVLERAMENPTEVGAGVVGSVVLPLVFGLFRGWFSYIVGAALLAVGAVAVAKYAFETGASLQETLTVAAVYGVVGVGVYRIIT